jgi:signal-transduction protein with cAMP-binding, CBS, and nucleotidyltransferase domain
MQYWRHHFRVLAQGRDPQTTLLGALHMMYEGGFRHVPVVEDGVPIGIVSARDVLGPELEVFACDLQRRDHIAESLG